MTNLTNHHQSTRMSEKGDFHWVLLHKVDTVWTLNLQGSYML